jgi:signal transduction histidine kinase
MQQRLDDQLSSLQHGSHVALFYHDKQEALSAAASFTAQGLERGEQCVYIMGEHPADVVRESLLAAGIPLAQREASGALVLLQTYQVPAETGAFDFTAIYDTLQEMINQATAHGYTGLRLVVDMTWTLAVQDNIEWLTTYEALGNHLLDTNPFIALCEYDRHRFEPATLRDMLRTHPYTLVDGCLCQNLYYERSDIVLDPDAVAEKVDWMMGQLVRAHQAENQRLRLIREQMARESAEEAQRQLQRFLGMVTHEMGNALSPILANLQLIQREMRGSLTERQERRFLAIETAEHRMQRLLRDLGDAANIGSGAFHTQLEPMDLVSVATQVVALQHAPDSARVVLDAPKELMGNWDRERISQVLVNLVSNALKYSPPNAEVRVTIHRAGDEVIVQVADRGWGISPDHLSHLFQPFARVYDGHEDGYKIAGTGLGLYISKGIVEAHGGRIWVKSEPGNGSTFTVALPGTAEQATATPTSSNASNGQELIA